MSESQLLHIALIQMDIQIGEPDTNFAQLEKLLHQAVEWRSKA